MGIGNCRAGSAVAVEVPIPAGTVGNLRVELSATLIAGGFVFDVQQSIGPTGTSGPVGPTNTGITCTIDASAAAAVGPGTTGGFVACFDTTNTFSFTDFDLISVKATSTGSPTPGVGAKFSLTHTVP